MDKEFFLNAELDGNSFTYEGNKIGILLIHGFTATTTEVRLLANNLYKHGYTIHAPLLTGHGTSPDQLNKTTYQAWLDNAEEAYSLLHQKCSIVFIAGESMGALLSLYLAMKHKEICGVICYSPAISVRFLWISLIARLFKPEIPKTGASDDLPWKGYKVNPTSASAELYKLQKRIRKDLKSIQQPVCVFIGGKDIRISHNAGKYILDHVSSSRKEIHLFENSPHCMILAQDLPIITEMTITFIQDISKSPAPQSLPSN
jgi:carboxylesterase